MDCDQTLVPLQEKVIQPYVSFVENQWLLTDNARTSQNPKHLLVKANCDIRHKPTSIANKGQKTLPFPLYHYMSQILLQPKHQLQELKLNLLHSWQNLPKQYIGETNNTMAQKFRSHMFNIKQKKSYWCSGCSRLKKRLLRHGRCQHQGPRFHPPPTTNTSRPQLETHIRKTWNTPTLLSNT